MRCNMPSGKPGDPTNHQYASPRRRGDPRLTTGAATIDKTRLANLEPCVHTQALGASHATVDEEEARIWKAGGIDAAHRAPSLPSSAGRAFEFGHDPAGPGCEQLPSLPSSAGRPFEFRHDRAGPGCEQLRLSGCSSLLPQPVYSLAPDMPFTTAGGGALCSRCRLKTSSQTLADNSLWCPAAWEFAVALRSRSAWRSVEWRSVEWRSVVWRSLVWRSSRRWCPGLRR